MSTKMEQLKELFAERSILSAGEVVASGFPSTYLSRLERQGEIERFAPGMFSVVAGAVSERWTVVRLMRIAPSAVLFLASALRFHELTTVNPHELHVAIPEHTRLPKSTLPVVAYCRAEGLYRLGIEEHTFDDGVVRVYSLEKTLVDCFKFRNRVGRDLAVEALREAFRVKRVDLQKLWEMASASHMTQVMLPYLESQL